MYTPRTLIATAVLLFVLPTTGRAQTPTFQRMDYATADAPRGITTADFNRDGAPDLALVNTGRKSVVVMMNETGLGRGFVQRYEIVLGGGPFEVVAGDVNNDAVTDLVVANADLNTIDIVRGRVAGGFDAPEHLAAAGFPRGVALGDLDRDGAEDIVYTQYDLDRVQILHGDGAGHFTARVAALPTGPRPQGVVVGDFIGCCRRDIAVANTTARYVTVLRQDDTTTFRRVDVPGSSSLNVLTTGDFNKDGHVDLAGVSTASNTMVLFRDTGSGLGVYGVFNTGGSPRGIAAVDLDKDGWLDLAVANRSASNVSMYMGRPDNPGWFAAPFAVGAGNGARDVVAADFNLDGHADLATANESGDSASVLTNVVAVSAGPFWEARALRSLDIFTPFVAVAEFNGNSVPDVIRSDGVLLDGTSLVPLDSGGSIPRSVTGGVAGDVNADGRMDVVLIALYHDGNYPQPTGAELYLGNGSGGFKYAGTFGSFGYAYEIKAADLNKDGRSDVVVASSNVSAPGGRIDVLFGTASGLAPQPVLNLSSAPNDFDIADFDRDGALDLAVSYGFDGYGIQLLTGNGTGSFSKGEFLPSSDARTTVHATDVNHDGIVDLLTGGGGPLMVWLGAANGTFGQAKAYGDNTFRLVVADFTGDGHPDIINSESALMRGTGTGAFSAPEPLNIWFDDAQPVDYDHDGRMDVVLVNFFHTMVLFNRATRGPNLAPVAIAGPDQTFSYESQFGEPECGGPGPSFDPNLDNLTYEWRDEGGRIVGREPFPCTAPLASGTYTFTLILRDGHGGESSDSKTFTVTPFKESVAVLEYSGTDLHGAWQRAADSTAASGYRMWHPDAGAAKLNAALASPVHYVDTWLLVDPSRTYKLWVRLKAQNDSWANDSIFVQFEGGAMAGTASRYAIGTTEALAINLEECSGCGVAGWGWRDERWGSTLKSAPVLLRFPTGGWQRVRVQTREDGVSIDQIVLSSEKYLSAPPGPAKRDNTLLSPRP